LIKWKEEGGESKGRSWNLPHWVTLMNLI
jgi:hypothetical protein